MVFANYMPNPDKGSSASTQRNGMEYPLGCLIKTPALFSIIFTSFV